MESKFLGQSLLREQLHLRQKRNKSYSLRAFSRDLGIDKTTLSHYINGQRCISKNNISKISPHFDLSEDTITNLISEYEDNRNRIINDIDYEKIIGDDLILFDKWQNIAILTLSAIHNHLADTEWISRFLNISKQEVLESIEFLVNHNHIEIKNNKIINLHKKITSSNNKPSLSLKRFHHNSLLRAQEALFEVDVEQRYYMTTNFVSTRDKIKTANKMIHEFQRKLVNYLEEVDEEEKTEVLTLGIQLYPTNCLNVEDSHETI